MFGYTNEYSVRVSEQCCFAPLKQKLSLVAAFRSFWPHTVSKPQASMSVWATRGNTRIEGRPKGYSDIIYVKVLRAVS